MHGSIRALALLAVINAVNAATHQMITGTFGTPFLYTVEFDDEALTLALVGNKTVSSPSSWINFNHDKTALYGNMYGSTGFMSYAVENATSLTHTQTITTGGPNCTASSIFQVADHNPPHAVYGAYTGATGQGECGTTMSVDATGALAETIQTFTYQTVSGVHGTVISPDSQFLYSTDGKENSLWTHRIDRTTGAVTFVHELEHAVAGANPRHVAMHPRGTYLYLLLEGTSQVTQYRVPDARTGVPEPTNATFPLLLPGLDAADYWADEVALSASGRYLWATNRGRASNGFISMFTLADDGAITAQNFLLNTTSGGGSANAVTPSPFSDRFVALTDSDTGFVEVWALSADAASAAPVAHLDIVDNEAGLWKGCCANVVWYN